MLENCYYINRSVPFWGLQQPLCGVSLFVCHVFCKLVCLSLPVFNPFSMVLCQGEKTPSCGGVWWPWRESPEVVLWSGLVMLLWSLQIMLWGSFKAWVLVTLLFLWTLNINKKSNPVRFVFIQMQTHTCLAFVVWWMRTWNVTWLLYPGLQNPKISKYPTLSIVSWLSSQF